MICKMSVFLAYAMAIYTIASIYYYIRTRYVGTPFSDSLTKEQRDIKRKSANVRKNIFCQGVILSIVTLIILKPFQKC
jgi:hypothetical protein